MIVVMNPSTTDCEVDEVERKLTGFGWGVHRSNGQNPYVLRISGDCGVEATIELKKIPCVEKVVLPHYPFELVSRDYQQEKTVFRVGEVEIGAQKPVVMGGPCAVEGRESFLRVAEAVKEAGADVLRGGAYKPRSSPYAFQGLEEEGLKIMAEARDITGLPIITEVLDQYSVEVVAAYADIIQVGTRNMQNFRLLRELGQLKKPVLIKRGMSATIEEWLMAAEYVLSEGNEKVILCERGIRTFETYTRNTLDISAVPIVKGLSHLPIFVDPSHGTGLWRCVSPMSMAAIAAGADGLLIEVHASPKEALCDGSQSLVPEKFALLMHSMKKMAEIIDRTI